MFLKCYDKTNNLMIPDNSSTDYARMLVFVFGFFVYWKITTNSRASGNTWFTIRDYKVVASMLSKTQNVTSEKTIFKVLFQ